MTIGNRVSVNENRRRYAICSALEERKKKKEGKNTRGCPAPLSNLFCAQPQFEYHAFLSLSLSLSFPNILSPPPPCRSSGGEKVIFPEGSSKITVPSYEVDEVVSALQGCSWQGDLARSQDSKTRCNSWHILGRSCIERALARARVGGREGGRDILLSFLIGAEYMEYRGPAGIAGLDHSEIRNTRQARTNIHEYTCLFLSLSLWFRSAIIPEPGSIDSKRGRKMKEFIQLSSYFNCV